MVFQLFGGFFQQLKDHPDIIVRKADKSNVFVILDKNEYKQKLDLILSDTQKFKRITRNPINELKIEVKKLIKKVNLGSKQYIIKPITGEYSHGYLYGTVKIHQQPH